MYFGYNEIQRWQSRSYPGQLPATFLIAQPWNNKLFHQYAPSIVLSLLTIKVLVSIFVHGLPLGLKPTSKDTSNLFGLLLTPFLNKAWRMQVIKELGYCKSFGLCGRSGLYL
ncbi:hypothetical protein SLA2020_214480 [Shorea laevis]